MADEHVLQLQDHLLTIMQCRLCKHAFYITNGYQCPSYTGLLYYLHIMNKIDIAIKISLYIIVIIMSLTIYSVFNERIYQKHLFYL